MVEKHVNLLQRKIYNVNKLKLLWVLWQIMKVENQHVYYEFVIYIIRQGQS